MKNRKTRHLPSGVLVVAVCAGLALSLQGATSAGASPAASPNFATDVSANRTADQAAELYEPAIDQDQMFGGLVITDAGLRMDVVKAGTSSPAAALAKSSALTSARNNLATMVPVTTRMVNNSLADLQALTATLDKAAPTWTARGVVMSMWGPDLDRNKVVVTLETYSAEAAAQLVAAYGSGVLAVDPGSQANTASSRTNDTSPFFGANEITDNSENCTSWFSTKSNSSSTQYQFTALHCGGGQTWKVISGGSFGSTSSSKWSGSVDAQSFKKTGIASVWADPTQSSRPVHGISTTNTVGGLVCTDGYVDKEVCSVKIKGSGVSVSYDGHTVTDTVRAHQTAGHNAFSAGDSGGPVYTTLSGGAVNARGMILSRSTSDASTGNYGKVANIQSAFGVTVMTQ